MQVAFLSTLFQGSEKGTRNISFVWINHLDLIRPLKSFVLDIFTDIPLMGKGSELKLSKSGA